MVKPAQCKGCGKPVRETVGKSGYCKECIAQSVLHKQVTPESPHPRNLSALAPKPLYHLTPANLGEVATLRPSMPAEVLINNKVQWIEDIGAKEEFKSVSFGTDIEKILEHNPILKGNIYELVEPKGKLIDYSQTGWEQEIDFAATGEHRVMGNAVVRKVGTFEMTPTLTGLKPKIMLSDEPKGRKAAAVRKIDTSDVCAFSYVELVERTKMAGLRTSSTKESMLRRLKEIGAL